MSEKAVIEKAQAAVGRDDTIVAAAWFQPRGTSGSFVGGSVAGQTLGHALGGGIGGALGDLAGAAIGMEAAKHSKDFGAGGGDGAVVHQVPWRSLVAVSDSRIYAWRIAIGLHETPGDVIFVLDRSEITVDVHSRTAVHVFEVTHVPTDEKWELEAERFGSHLKDLLSALNHVDSSVTG
jgi:hypothetical protein